MRFVFDPFLVRLDFTRFRESDFGYNRADDGIDEYRAQHNGVDLRAYRRQRRHCDLRHTYFYAGLGQQRPAEIFRDNGVGFCQFAPRIRSDVFAYGAGENIYNAYNAYRRYYLNIQLRARNNEK